MKYPEILSLQAAPSEVSYTRQKAILYALGVGVGNEALDDDDLSFVYEERLRLLPTMSTILFGDGKLLAGADINQRMVLHSEQHLRIHSPLPLEGRMTIKSRVLNVADKGKEKGAVVYTENAISDPETGQLYSTVTQVLYCRGDGGFDGPNENPFPARDRPARPADAETIMKTAPNQAALYRQSIDDLTPLHIDPDYAARLGFEKPLLHGLCNIGIACRAVMKAHCDNDPARVRSFGARFASPFFPGETMLIRSWREGGDIAFEALSVERQVVVLSSGYCEIAT